MTESYRFLPNNQPGVMDLSDGAVIPPDPSGWRWLKYMAWMYAGGEALPAVELAPWVRRLDKLTMVQRLTDVEMVALLAAKEQFPLRERTLYDSASTINVDDPTIRAAFNAVLGEERANVVLDVS